jgi:type I restriction enzyme S subunit
MPEFAPPIAVSNAEWGIIQNILRQFAPKGEVWAFGSRAKFTAKPFSDLDIVLVGSLLGRPALSLGEMADLGDAFSSSDLPYKVDIIDWFSISDEFKKVIDEHRVLIYQPLIAG